MDSSTTYETTVPEAFLKKCFGLLAGTLAVWQKKLWGRKSFVMAGRELDYFYHRKNRTWENERAIELPIIWGVLSRNRGKRILEIGNVLRRYFSNPHDVIDKYEKGQLVRNIDVVDFKPEERYDLVVSISTLEHVGFDEQPQEPEKVIRAFKHLEKIVRPGGEAHVTFPVGYNRFLDQYIRDGKIKFTEIYFFRRISPDNQWRETDWDGVKDAGYHKGKTWYANGLAYGIISF